MTKNSKKIEVCIIGSGAGGGVVAKELAQAGIHVVVLEAGRRFNPLYDFDVSTMSAWDRFSAANYKKNFYLAKMATVTYGNEGIRRPFEAFGVGGSTLIYEANKLRMLPDDFRIYSLDGVGFDWPITYQDLVPYYRKVELELGVSGKSGDPWFPNVEEYPNPPHDYSYATKILKKSFDKLGIKLWPQPVGRLSRPFDGRPSCVKCGRCMDGCMTKAKSSMDVTYIPKAVSTGKADIRPESVASRITVDSKGRAKSVIYFDKNGVEHEQEADIIIVSAGSIQSPRLLLNSKSSIFPDGLSNNNGLVGRYYMTHRVTVKAMFRLSERLDSFRGWGGANSFEFAKTNKQNSFARGWSLKPKNDHRGPASFAFKNSGWGVLHKDYMRKKFGHTAGIRAMGEQLPDERNRVELDPTVVDHYGMPVPRITNKMFRNEKLMLKAMEKQIRELSSIIGGTQLEWTKNYSTAAHNMGTCRMGNNPKTSVVNSFCQSHDVPNLFVVDASCFVTGGVSNPSLTIQAIATRASAYIIEEGKKGNLWSKTAQ